MISAEQFIDLLVEKDLLPSKVIGSLRKRVAESKKPIPAASVAKLLIKKGHLTPALAKRLLAAGKEPADTPTPEPRKTVPKSQEDDLGLAPLDEDRAEKTAKPQAAKTIKPQAAPSLLAEELPDLAGGEGELAGMGPLDGLMAGASLEEAAAGGPLAPVAPGKRGLWRLFFRGKKRRAGKENVWDSSLMLIGGGALLLLVILGGALLWAVMRGSGDEALDLANEAYRAGSYTQAISKYNQYLRKFPKHNGVSIARVRRGLSQLRQVTARGTTNWSGALETAKRLLGEIGPEREFKEAHGDLSVMLLAIAEGLARQAHENTDPALLALTNEALALMEKVPRSRRPGAKLSAVKASLALTERDIARGRQRDKSIATINEAVSKSNTAEAYKIRKTLLTQYPLLANDERLAQAVLTISQAQQAAVETIEKPQQAATSEPDTPILSSVTLAQTVKTADAPAVEGYVVWAAADGAAYGLDATTGRLLWRRFVGFAGSARGLRFPPTPISPSAGSDVLLVDSARNELLRVKATTGQTVWRHPLPERFDAHPVITPGKLLVATRSGRLVTIDPESGNSTGYMQLPQSVRVAATVQRRSGLLFQPADHSNLFVLSLADGSCRQVVHLGHDPGSITASPVVAGRYLILVINDRAEDSTLHVLDIGRSKEPDSPLCKPIMQLRLRGHVDFPVVVAGRRVLVATDLGAVTVFELGGADAKNPLRKVAALPAAGEKNLVRFPLVQGGQFYLAGARLTKYDILAAHRRIVPKWIIDEQSTFLQPLTAIGQTIFHVRRTPGMPGVLVAAVDMDEPYRYWETQLDAPLAAEPIVEGAAGAITAVTTAGGVFRFEPAAGKPRTVVDRPTVALDPALLRRPISDVIPLEGGLLGLSTSKGSRQIDIYDPQLQGRFRQLVLPDPLACRPIAFAGGLLAPSLPGHVSLVDLRRGKKLVEPFMPRLQSGIQLAWTPPAAFGENEVVLSDGRSKLYRLAIRREGKPHLAALGSVELSEPVVSPIAIVGNVAYAVDTSNVLAAFELPSLGRGKQWPLAGGVVWGPRRIGDRVMLATENGQLLCLDEKQKLAWQVALPSGPVAGKPTMVEGGIVLAAKSGLVWRLDAATGKQLGAIDTGRPLATGPVPRGARLLVGGHDGTLYEIEQP